MLTDGGGVNTQDTESEQNSDDNQMPQFVLNADGDEETPVDDALVLAVRYSYRGVSCAVTSSRACVC